MAYQQILIHFSSFPSNTTYAPHVTRSITSLVKRSKCRSARWLIFYWGMAECIKETVDEMKDKNKTKKHQETEAVTTITTDTVEEITTEETEVVYEVVYDDISRPVGVKAAGSPSNATTPVQRKAGEDNILVVA